MAEQKTTSAWLHTAVAGIRFKPDREAVEAELREHIEDKTADLMRIFPDMTEEEARERALSQMGDPEEIGKELARIHKPWLGYLWVASRTALLLILAVSIFHWGSRAVERVQDWWQYGQQGPGYEESIKEYYYNGQDPFRPDSPWYDENNTTGVVRTPLRVWQPGETAQAGTYRFSIERAALWSFQGGPDPEEDWWLFCTLRAWGLPWEPFSLEAAWRVRAVDSFGNQYYDSFQVYELGEDRGEAGYVMVNSGDSGLFHEGFDLEIIDIAPGAEWIRLEFDRGGPVWSLTIPLTEDTP